MVIVYWGVSSRTKNATVSLPVFLFILRVSEWGKWIYMLSSHILSIEFDLL